MATAVKKLTTKLTTKQSDRQQSVKRVSKTWLAMEELRENPAIRILDMRAVLR